MIDSEPLLRLEQLPVQQNKVHRTREEAISCVRGDVLLVQDMHTGIVHNVAFDPGLMIYDATYQNEQGCSTVFQQHLSDVADIIKKYLNHGPVVEVGCGKGTFLEYLRSLGCDVIGVDPAYEGSAPYVVKDIFSRDIGFWGEVVVLRHVLEHIPDPFSFLDAIAEANDRRGLIYIEVPCLDWIKNNMAWFDIFYEHVNYFRLDNFSRLFTRIIESGKLFRGQYLYIVADLGSLQRPEGFVDELFSFGDDFMSGLSDISKKLSIYKDRQVVVWGGASKGVILAQQVKYKSNLSFSFAIDINPAKQGGFFPGTGLPVLSPEDGLRALAEGDVILIMNSNYAREIIDRAGRGFSYTCADSVLINQ